MELTVKNVEQYFNLLQKSKIKTENKKNEDVYISLFDIVIVSEIPEDYLILIEKDNEETKFSLKHDKDFAEKYSMYYLIKDIFKSLSDAYRNDHKISITATKLESFNNEIKSVYKRVDYLNKAIDKVKSDFRSKDLMNNDQARKQLTRVTSETNACNKQIEEDKTNFLYRIIELGMCKAAIKKHLCTNSDELLLKDFFDRYFVLKCNGMLNG